MTAPEEQERRHPRNHRRPYQGLPHAAVRGHVPHLLVRPLPEAADRDPLTPLRGQPPHLDINWVNVPAGLSADEKPPWLEKLLSENGQGFTLTTSRRRINLRRPAGRRFQSLPRPREGRKISTGRRSITSPTSSSGHSLPETSGTYRFGPATVKGTFCGRRRRPQLQRPADCRRRPGRPGRSSRGPSPRPATFCGGVGQYTVSAAASPTTCGPSETR